MRRALQIVALALASVLLLGPLAQAETSCRSLRGMGQCSNCPLPHPASNCDNIAPANSSCCQVTAARTVPDTIWQPVVSYALAPPSRTAFPGLLSPAPFATADHGSSPPTAPAQALLCTFLI